MTDPEEANPLGPSRILAPITTVHRGEARRALLLTLNFFLLFTAYYMLKPVRESLILSLQRGAEIKSYTSGLQAIAFAFIVPIYSKIAGRFSGRGLLTAVYLFLASNLVIFIALSTIEFEYLGIVYFVWVGMFNLFSISQTWSLCSDIYSPGQGKRLFPLIALGASSGAVFGSLVLGSLIKTKGVYWPLSIAAAILCLCSVLVFATAPKTSPIGNSDDSDSFWRRLSGGMGIVAGNRYITYVALLILVANMVNTTSEYMLGKLVAEYAQDQASTGAISAESIPIVIGAFYARFYFWISILTLLLQLFIVSRVIRRFGIEAALFAVPLIAFFSYTIILITPILAVIRIVKIIENATNYSINNTARELLFLPLGREEKYKAKFAVDTFFWRGGDTLSGGAVFLMSGVMGLGIVAFAGINAVLVLFWMLIVRRISTSRRDLIKRELKS